MVKEKGVERMRVEGKASGGVTGTFIWDEEHREAAGPGRENPYQELTQRWVSLRMILLNFV